MSLIHAYLGFAIIVCQRGTGLEVEEMKQYPLYTIFLKSSIAIPNDLMYYTLCRDSFCKYFEFGDIFIFLWHKFLGIFVELTPIRAGALISFCTPSFSSVCCLLRVLE